jgi:rod shape-determining protein MreC
MRNFIRFILKHHFILLFLMIEVACLVMVLNYNSYQRAAWLSSSNRISGAIYRSYSNTSQYLMLRRINEELAAENTYLRSQLPESFRVSKDYFNTVYDSLSEQQFIYRTAQVINNSVNKYFNYMTLNKGYQHGIREEMGVISSKGVVGVVKNVSDHYSTVISILNTRLLISAKLKESGFFGALEWDGRRYTHAWLNEIPMHASVAVGDLVVTSGYSAIFPEGILLGTVDQVEKDKGESFYRIKVKLSVDFKDLAYVEVIGNAMREERLELEKESADD